MNFTKAKQSKTPGKALFFKTRLTNFLVMFNGQNGQSQGKLSQENRDNDAGNFLTRGDTYVSGRTSFGVRQRAGFRARFGGVGSQPRPQACQFIVRERGALGRRSLPLQLH